jgi:hypothetical protein
VRALLILVAATLALPLLWVALRPPVPEAPTPSAAGTSGPGPGGLLHLPGGGVFDPAADPLPGREPTDDASRQGVLLTPDGILRGGTFDDAWRLHGTGWQRAPDGTRHDGAFDHGTRSGDGVAVTADGTVTAGVWARGRPSGAGHRVDAGGRRFSGPFRDGVPAGRGWCFDGGTVRACAADDRDGGRGAP